MSMNKVWTTNVETEEGFNASYLHEYATAMIWEVLRGGQAEVLNEDGIWETVVAGEIQSVFVPNSLTSFGGVTPDLAIRDSYGVPIVAIEVVVTNKPTDSKREKIESLRKRGLQVVVTRQIQGPDDLRDFVRARSDSEDFADSWLMMFSKKIRERGWAYFLDRYPWHRAKVFAPNMKEDTSRERLDRQHSADRYIEEMMLHLAFCSPEKRRSLFRMLKAATNVHAQYPISTGNPKFEALWKATQEFSEETAE